MTGDCKNDAKEQLYLNFMQSIDVAKKMLQVVGIITHMNSFTSRVQKTHDMDLIRCAREVEKLMWKTVVVQADVKAHVVRGNCR